MSVPIAAAIVFLMGVGPALPWGQARPGLLRERLLVPLVVGVVTAVACLAFGLVKPWAVAVFGLSGFTAATHAREFLDPARARARNTGESVAVALWGVTSRARRRFGGDIVHMGVLLIAVAVAASSNYRTQSHQTLLEGQSATVAGYTLTYLGAETINEPHRTAQLARFGVARGGSDLGELSPAMNHYKRMGQPIGTPAVRSGLRDDLYLSLIQVDQASKTVSLDVIVEPLVWWIWFGGGVMVLGTLVAAWPERRRALGAPGQGAA